MDDEMDVLARQDSSQGNRLWDTGGEGVGAELVISIRVGRNGLEISIAHTHKHTHMLGTMVERGSLQPPVFLLQQHLEFRTILDVVIVFTLG